jgi:hypothetical protein
VIEGHTSEIGKIIKWMERVNSHGQMVEYTRVNIKMIKKKVMEFSNGQMAVNTKAIGRMENNTAMANSITPPPNNGKQEYGMMVNAPVGQLVVNQKLNKLILFQI